MKIFQNSSVFIQKQDLIYLCYYEKNIPLSMIIKMYTEIINNDNMYEFTEFKEYNEIELIKKIDWIIDLNTVKDLNENELEELKKNILDKSEKIMSYIKQMSIEGKSNIKMDIEWILNNYKYNSLNNINLNKEEMLKIKSNRKKLKVL